MKPTEDEVHNALKSIVNNRDVKALNWAVNYTEAGLYMSGEALHVQCLYTLNNIPYWRGEEAKQVRDILGRFTE